MTPHVKRDIAGSVRAAPEDMPGVVVTGMRQAGMSVSSRGDSEDFFG
jgi:hypothetical protein